MTPREFVLQQALALPEDDQVFVALALGDHLIPPETEAADGLSGEAFLDELEQRSARYCSGQSMARDADEVIRDLRQRQPL
jgi:hypothetical protein